MTSAVAIQLSHYAKAGYMVIRGYEVEHGE